MQSPISSINLLGMDLAAFDTRRLLDHVGAELEAGRGGWIVTANLDILRRYVLDADARALYAAADLRVADGMPLVWASRLQGEGLPERVAGSSLIHDFAALAAKHRRSIYLLGGAEGAAEGCAMAFRERYPDLNVVGWSSPMITSPPTELEVAGLRRELESRRPDIVLVALGSPKQEYVCRVLRSMLPRAWLVGVGMSFGFASGQMRRAPRWMQDAGLEWVHRLGQEPRRLARRYLVDDLPFAARLFGSALARRVGATRSETAPPVPAAAKEAGVRAAPEK